MDLLYNKSFVDDLNYTAGLDLPWDKLKDSSILISGASGMIGSYFVDVLMYKNEHDALNCSIYAVGRNEIRAKKRFSFYWDSDLFQFFLCDINEGIELSLDRIDYIFHAASNTHPVAYATDPIGTITTNIIGLYNLLEFASNHNCRRFVFASSNEIYGENRGDVELFKEDYCGYINCNTMRAGYPESKRCGEALCQAYKVQKKLDIVIPRFTRSYGPTMKMDDTKAISQFIKKCINGEDIVLKSEGNQYYSYTYVADAVAGLLTVLLKGENGEAYNIADENSDIRLKDLAEILANLAGTKVIFEIPDNVEKTGYSTATKARLDGSKVKGLGWQPRYNIISGMKRNINILRESII